MAEVKVNGLNELGVALKAFGEVLGKKYLARATLTATALIHADAVARAPVRTGALRDAIAIFKRKDDGSTAHFAVGVRRIKTTRAVRRVIRAIQKDQGIKRLTIDGDSFYWKFDEFGTSKMAPRPFMRPAFEEQKGNALEVFRVSLADGVQAAAAEVKK